MKTFFFSFFLSNCSVLSAAPDRDIPYAEMDMDMYMDELKLKLRLISFSSHSRPIRYSARRKQRNQLQTVSLFRGSRTARSRSYRRECNVESQ